MRKRNRTKESIADVIQNTDKYNIINVRHDMKTGKFTLAYLSKGSINVNEISGGNDYVKKLWSASNRMDLSKMLLK